MAFVEHALSIKGNVQFGKSRLMLHDKGPLGTKALATRAGMNDLQARVLRAACVIYHDLEETSQFYSREQFQACMIERIMTLSLPWSESDEAWFMERLNGRNDDFLTV